MNLRSVCEASGGSLDNVIKLNIYLINMDFFSRVNEIMTEFFCEPFPARAAVGVSSLPKGALIEAEAVLFLGN